MVTYSALWKISSGALLALIVGCSTTPVIKYVPTYIETPIICSIPEPVAPTLFTDLEVSKVQDAEGKWWFPLDSKNFKKAALNNARIKKYLVDLEDYTTALKACYEKESD